MNLEYTDLKCDGYKVGNEDEFGNKIRKIYIRSKGSYIIYECENSEDLSFEGTNEAQLKYSKIVGHVASITGRFNSEFKKHNFLKEQVVYAMVESIEGDYEEAEKILNSLEERIIKLRKKEGKLHYLEGAFTVTLFNVVISTVFLLIHNKIGDDLIKESIFVFHVITSGSLGGMLSIAININKFEIDSDAGVNNFITGMSRTLIAMIGSFFIYFAAKSNIIAGFSENAVYRKYLMIVLGMISGFSETFVPNIMNKVQNEKEKSDEISM